MRLSRQRLDASGTDVVRVAIGTLSDDEALGELVGLLLGRDVAVS